VSRHRILPTVVLSLLVLAALSLSTLSLAADSETRKDRKRVPHSGGFEDLPKPLPQTLDGISRATEDVRKGLERAASKAANAVTIHGDDKKK
jgi:hypothetical protein